MDFSFVDSEPAGRPTGQQLPAQGQPARPLLQLPTWQQVQAANQASAPTILFRPTGLLSAARQQQQQQQPHAPSENSGAPPQPAGTAAGPSHGPGPPSSSSTFPGAPWGQGAPPPGAGAHQGGGPPWTTGGPGPGPGGAQGQGWGGGSGGVYGGFSGATGGGGAGPSGNGSSGGGSGGPPPVQCHPPAPRPAGGYVVQQPPAGPARPPNVVLVNRRQQGNPVLKHIRNVRWQFADIVPDYQLGQNTAALFLSLRYHLLRPDYILHRIKEQQRMFRLTVLLVHVDVDDVVKPLGEVTRAAVVGDCTLVCGWTPEECARWLETYKSYESKPASSIQERVEPDYVSRLAAVLAGSVRGINRTDAHTLGTSFGSLAAMMRCNDPDAFSACPGIGPTKVRRLMEAFHEPFRKQLRMTGVGAGQGGGMGGPSPSAATAAAATTTAAAAAAPAGISAETPKPSAAPTTSAPVAAVATMGASAALVPGQGPHVDDGAGPNGQVGRPSGWPESEGVAANATAEKKTNEAGGSDEDLSALDGDEAFEDERGSAGGELEGVRRDQQTQQQHLGEEVVDVDVASTGSEAQRQRLLELLMSQMPAGDDDVTDSDEDYRL